MKLRLINYILFIILVGLLSGCPCPTDLPGDKVVVPNDKANVKFINASPYVTTVGIKSLFTTISGNADYYTKDLPYLKFEAGQNTLKVYNSGTNNTYYNTVCDFQKDHYYTVFIYGEEERLGVFLFEDSIPNYLNTKSYFRLIHLAPDTNIVEFWINNSFIKYYEKYYKFYNEQPKDVDSGTYSFEVRMESDTSKVLAKLDRLEMKAGCYYYILFKGINNNSNGKQMSLEAIGTRYN